MKRADYKKTVVTHGYWQDMKSKKDMKRWAKREVRRKNKKISLDN